MNHPLPWLRYVDANRVDSTNLVFDGLKVRNEAMETLGSVEGFVIDNTSMRPYYVVVDSGGWFKSRVFLVPIGHARIDDDQAALVVNIAKERIERFPGFDLAEFETLKGEDISRMNDAICDAVGDTPTLDTPASHIPASSADPLSTAWGRPAFTQPDWWAMVSPPLGDTLCSTDGSFGVTDDDPALKVPMALGEMQADEMLQDDRERVDRQRRDSSRPSMGVNPTSVDDGAGRGEVTESREDREAVLARETDRSPDPDRRARPGG